MRHCLGRWQEVRSFGVVENHLGCGAVGDELTVSVFDVMRDVTLPLILRASLAQRLSHFLCLALPLPPPRQFGPDHTGLACF